MEKYYFRTSKISAEAFYENGSMIILKKSLANKSVGTSCSEKLLLIREKLISKGKLVPVKDNLMFTENFTCQSPSEASALINGTTSNGLTSWKNKEGKTLGWVLKQEE